MRYIPKLQDDKPCINPTKFSLNVVLVISLIKTKTASANNTE